MVEGSDNNCIKPALWYQAVELVAAAALIVQCRTIWMHLSMKGPLVNRGLFAVILPALIICGLFGRDGSLKLKITKHELKIYLITILYSLIFIIVNPVNYLRVVRVTLVLLAILLIFFSENAGDKVRAILLKYKNLMVIVAFVSVICWITLSMLHLYPYPWSGDVYVDWSDNGGIIRRSHFLYIYYETQWWIVDYVARNTAIFVEGPMACYCFLTALFINLNTEKNHRLKSFCTGTLVSAVVLCFTTAGYSVLFAYFCVFEYKRLRKSEYIMSIAHDRKKRKALTCAGITAAFILYFFMLSKKLASLSGTVRIDDIAAGLKAWLSRPWFGSGFENTTYITQFMSSWRLNNVGYSNSPIEILANGGLYLFIPFALAICVMIRNAVHSGNKKRMLTVALYVFLWSVTLIPYQYNTLFIMGALITGALWDDDKIIEDKDSD